MAMDIANDGESILGWNEDRVHQWFTALGFPQYEQQIRGALVRPVPATLYGSPRPIQTTTSRETFSAC